MTTATAPRPSAVPTIEIIRTPRPYMRGACVARCSNARLSGCFVSRAAARAYIAGLVAAGKAVAL